MEIFKILMNQRTKQKLKLILKKKKKKKLLKKFQKLKKKDEQILKEFFSYFKKINLSYIIQFEL